MSSDYDAYVRLAWAMFAGDEARQRASLDAVGGAVGVGVDAAPEAGLAGRELFAARAPAAGDWNRRRFSCCPSRE